MEVQLVILVKDAAENGHVPVAGITLTFTLRESEKKDDTHLSQGSLSRAEVEHKTKRIRNGDAIGWTVMFGDNSNKSQVDILCTNKPM